MALVMKYQGVIKKKILNLLHICNEQHKPYTTWTYQKCPIDFLLLFYSPWDLNKLIKWFILLQLWWHVYSFNVGKLEQARILADLEFYPNQRAPAGIVLLGSSQKAKQTKKQDTEK